MNNRTAKAKPKMTVKNGVVYGDALSAQEKKRIVMQKKKDRKAKKVRKSAQQTIPYVEMCRDGICKVNSRLYTKSIAFEDINYQLAQNEDKTAIFENWCDFLNYFDPYHADPERRMRVHCGGFLRHRSPCACMGGRGAVGAGCFLERERYSDVAVNAHQDARYNPMSDGVHERKEWIYWMIPCF